MGGKKKGFVFVNADLKPKDFMSKVSQIPTVIARNTYKIRAQIAPSVEIQPISGQEASGEMLSLSKDG